MRLHLRPDVLPTVCSAAEAEQQGDGRDEQHQRHWCRVMNTFTVDIAAISISSAAAAATVSCAH